MQDDLTAATSTPADDSVRADLEAALGDWDGGNETVAAETPADASTEAKPAAEADKTAEAKPATDGRARDEKGRFVAKDGSQTEQPSDQQTETPSEQPPAETPPQDQTQDQKAAVEGAPPPGWSIASKAAWDSLPANIRADVIKREQEVNNGFAKLRDYKGLDSFAEMARNSGTTLAEAMQNYVGMERLLRQDFKQGVMKIAHNMGVTLQQFQQMFGFTASQPHQNGQTSGNGQSDPGQDIDDPYVKAAVEAALRPLSQELNTLKSSLDQRTEAEKARQLAAIDAVVEDFRKSPDYRYFSDVEGTINSLIASKMVPLSGDHRKDLVTAYEMACQLNPEVREALFNERLSKTEEKRKAEADKAEAEKRSKAEAAARAAVSVKGAPTGPVSTPEGSRGSVKDDLAAAWDAHM